TTPARAPSRSSPGSRADSARSAASVSTPSSCPRAGGATSSPGARCQVARAASPTSSTLTPSHCWREPMTEPLTVWVPAARTVEISLPTGPDDDAAERRPLKAREDGWWTTPEPLAPGTDYLLLLDGGPGLPDPRSA